MAEDDGIQGTHVLEGDVAESEWLHLLAAPSSWGRVTRRGSPLLFLTGAFSHAAMGIGSGLEASHSPS